MAAPTKNEMIESLLARGIELKGDETVVELRHLIARDEVVLTEQDIKANPVLEEAGLKAGDVGTPAPAGTIIKTYIQNGLRYNRVVTDNGGTVDVRA